MPGMLMTKLRNEINKHPGAWGFHLKNIRVNESVRGCSGFIQNLATGKIVYVDTEPSVYGPLSKRVMFRTAEHLKDWTGGMNQWGDLEGNAFIEDIVRELRKPPKGFQS